MRISTSTLYSESVTTLNQLQSNLAQTNQQIGTGMRMLSPADDPAAAARAVDLMQSDTANTQYAFNRTAAVNTLSLSESILQGVTSLLQDAKTIAVNAGNGVLNQTDRQTLATDLQGRFQELMGLANSTDGAGNYLFSGGQGSAQPFINAAGGVQYQGDDVQRKVQAAATRQIATTDSGADIFMRARSGNGTFQTAPAAANTGSGVVSRGSVSNPALYNGNRYQVSFSVAAGVTTYSVTDVTNPATPLAVAGQTAVPYVSGQAVSFNGISFDVQGAPANGDIFNVSPSVNQSVFTTLDNLIKTLSAGGSPTALRQGLNDALGNLDQGLSNVLGVRATVGARLRELDALQATGDAMGGQYKQTLAQLQNVDYNKAISDLAQQQMTLQAAQKSFAQISGLSLFNYLR